MQMNKHLAQLIEISKIDKESDMLEPLIAQERSALDKLLAQKKDSDSKIAALNEQEQELKLAIARNELNIQENSQKIETIAQKTKEVKSDREAKALSMEEDLAKEQIKHANNEIERINKELDSKKAQEQEMQSNLSELATQISTAQQEADTQIDKIKQKQKEIWAKKEAAIAQMDQKVIFFYEKIRKWAKNTSVVPVKKQACGGCFIHLSDRVYSDIVQSSDIVTCPHCGRILYIESNA